MLGSEELGSGGLKSGGWRWWVGVGGVGFGRSGKLGIGGIVVRGVGGLKSGELGS